MQELEIIIKRKALEFGPVGAMMYLIGFKEGLINTVSPDAYLIKFADQLITELEYELANIRRSKKVHELC